MPPTLKKNKRASALTVRLSRSDDMKSLSETKNVIEQIVKTAEMNFDEFSSYSQFSFFMFLLRFILNLKWINGLEKILSHVDRQTHTHIHNLSFFLSLSLSQHMFAVDLTNKHP